jgi:UDP-N-acetylmuramate dehydrogenase
MNIEKNKSLLPYNTFKMDVKADQFVAFNSVSSLQKLLLIPEIKNQPKLILGGGSNVLLTADFLGTVLKNEIVGIEVIQEDEQFVFVKVGAGESWHHFVMHAVEQGWGGVENLALIPGSVGAAPMQNIGAYGVELKDVFHELDAVVFADASIKSFGKSDCCFGYRESIFKHELKDTLVIAYVVFKLHKHAVVKTEYGAIKDELTKMGIVNPGIKEVAEAVMQIRKSKLPDPAVLGNAGSFFKNPEIDLATFELLKSTYPDMVGYPMPGFKVKLAAGWLIEKAGWKGVRYGDVGCHDKQALVLVNYGHATGSEVFQLSENIISAVLEKFGVQLHREVNIY